MIAQLIQQLQTGCQVHPKYSWRHDLLWCNGKIYVPDNKIIREQLLYEYHSTHMGGHAGTIRTYA